MASARDLKKKIRSIANTKKITRTMELVATSKAKRAQDRVNANTPYSTKLAEILENLTRAGGLEHPLLARPEKVERAAFVVVTGKRGLCGGYNSSVLSLLEKAYRQAKGQGIAVDVYAVGRKGIQRLRFLGIAVTASYTHFDDRPSFEDAADIARTLMRRFIGGEVQQVTVFSTRYLSAGSQKAAESQLLPFQTAAAAPAGKAKAKAKAAGGKKSEVEFILEPDPRSMLEAILPLSVCALVYRLLVEAIASEQIARRMAMKRATDSAEDMVKAYTRIYNRSRQAGITQQLNEIVSGANALE